MILVLLVVVFVGCRWVLGSSVTSVYVAPAYVPANNAGTLCSGNRHQLRRTLPHGLTPLVPSDFTGTERTTGIIEGRALLRDDYCVVGGVGDGGFGWSWCLLMIVSLTLGVMLVFGGVDIFVCFWCVRWCWYCFAVEGVCWCCWCCWCCCCVSFRVFFMMLVFADVDSMSVMTLALTQLFSRVMVVCATFCWLCSSSFSLSFPLCRSGMGRTHGKDTTFARAADNMGFVPKEDILEHCKVRLYVFEYSL